ncbi:DnaB-like helicase C-terminal domain-containing protein [Verrucosispora sp. WMMC514]|uniref:replicative DNA helicase n=1 Tax=Verrucosispora sp. WMMC514 TaxID=3015156 RepID=UPI00248D168C|nr:DnaB-like helicase C-terminal domain-containing protein [Verrucosispora sp. WMMC514]WBB94231.1 AAA family ATPase [Verrucosispora sp. WMMC514]
MMATADPHTTAAAPTFDVDSERALLGCLLLAGTHDRADDAMAEVEDLDRGVFYRPAHGDLFDAILAAWKDGKPIGPASIGAILADADASAFQRLGGAPYLHTLLASATTVAQVPHYRDRVLECAGRRDVQEDGVKLVQAASSGVSTEKLAQIATELAEKVTARRRTRDRDLIDLGSLINPALDDISTRLHRPKGITTGYSDLDAVLGGMNRKELILFAGATAMGKSIALVDVGRHVAIRLGLTVALFSLEMDRGMVFDRVLSAESGVPHRLIRDGLPDSAPEWGPIMAHIGPMANAPLYVSDRAPLRVADIDACCRRLKRSVALDLVIIDHMHLLLPSSDRITDATAKIADISTGCKRLAMGLDVPVLAAAQFNRAPAARMDKTPQMSDLRGASNIEQDADKIVLLHRPDYYDPDSPRRGEVDLIVAKNRAGQTETVTVAGQLHLSRFRDLARV